MLRPRKGKVAFNAKVLKLKDEDIQNAIEDAGFEAEILTEPCSSGSKPYKIQLGQFIIEGMTCAACVNSVEGILRDLHGVKRAVVALATALGEVEMAPSMRDLQLTAVNGAAADDMEDVRLLDSYEDRTNDKLLSIEEGMKRIQVRITGMTCTACLTSVEGALMAVNGVVKASVSLLQNKADVVFDPNSVKVVLLDFGLV
ncbi:hypothetical protein QYF36_002542 [Acer negundo]|nr:hypothetical protein QYF36_002542 [Acer negundo]